MKYFVTPQIDDVDVVSGYCGTMCMGIRLSALGISTAASSVDVVQHDGPDGPVVVETESRERPATVVGHVDEF